MDREIGVPVKLKDDVSGDQFCMAGDRAQRVMSGDDDGPLMTDNGDDRMSRDGDRAHLVTSGEPLSTGNGDRRWRR